MFAFGQWVSRSSLVLRGKSQIVLGSTCIHSRSFHARRDRVSSIHWGSCWSLIGLINKTGGITRSSCFLSFVHIEFQMHVPCRIDVDISLVQLLLRVGDFFVFVRFLSNTAKSPLSESQLSKTSLPLQLFAFLFEWLYRECVFESSTFWCSRFKVTGKWLKRFNPSSRLASDSCKMTALGLQ